MSTDNYQQLLSKKFHSAIEGINLGLPFAVIDLNLSNSDTAVLNSLQIDSAREYVNFNEIAFLYEEVTHFLQTLSPSNKSGLQTYISNLILNIVYGVMSTKKNSKYGIIIRIESSVPQHTNTIDWHVDKQPTEQHSLSTKKGTHIFLTSLKGPSTLYYLPSLEVDLKLHSECSKFYTPYECYSKIKVARMLNSDNISSYISPTNIFSAKQGSTTVHLMNSDIGIIHSTPQINKERLLLAVLMATPEDIESYHKRWLQNIKSKECFSLLTGSSRVYLK